MNRKRIIEMSAYTMIFLGLTVISPSIAKLIDHQYYPYPRLFSESPLTLLMGYVMLTVPFAFAMDDRHFQNDWQRHAVSVLATP